jgi:four helix bundle protein
LEAKQVKIQKHTDLEVYKKAFDTAMEVFHTSKKFPKEEMYSLTDQIRRASRSVCSNISEAWRKRRYEAAFVSKLSDAEAEAAEVQVWIQFAVKCGYLDRSIGEAFYKSYDSVLRMLVAMITAPQSWIIGKSR